MEVDRVRNETEGRSVRESGEQLFVRVHDGRLGHFASVMFLDEFGHDAEGAEDAGLHRFVGDFQAELALDALQEEERVEGVEVEVSAEEDRVRLERDMSTQFEVAAQNGGEAIDDFRACDFHRCAYASAEWSAATAGGPELQHPEFRRGCQGGGAKLNGRRFSTRASE